MKLLNADFVTSAARADGIPRDEVARVALAGRSNVGKSSLINALCRLKIARTSAAPGKTRLLNFYRITMEGGPGGPGRWPSTSSICRATATRGAATKSVEELAGIAREYYEDSDSARNFSSASATLLLVDSRHPGLKSDLAAGGWLNRLGVDVPRRRDEDRQAGAPRAREEPEGTRNNVWNGRIASFGNERRRIG